MYGRGGNRIADERGRGGISERGIRGKEIGKWKMRMSIYKWASKEETVTER
jgi:hypothetical protein